MERGLQGHYIQCSTSPEPLRAFIPSPLPPSPELLLDANLCDWLERANRALGRLDGIATLLPETSLFLYLYVRKEAVLSSQIEGTQSSFSDLLLYETDEAPGVPLDDVQEVSRYVAALNHGLMRLREGFPLSLRLIREITRYCYPKDAAAKNRQEHLEHPKTGLMAPVPAMPNTFRPLLNI
jgi:Fic family protein